MILHEKLENCSIEGGVRKESCFWFRNSAEEQDSDLNGG